MYNNNAVLEVPKKFNPECFLHPDGFNYVKEQENIIAKTAAFVENNTAWHSIFQTVLDSGVKIHGLDNVKNMNEIREQLSDNINITLGNVNYGCDDNFYPGINQVKKQIIPLLKKGKHININLSEVKPSSSYIDDKTAAQSPMQAIELIKKGLPKHQEYRLSFSISTDHPDIQIFLSCYEKKRIRNTIFIEVTNNLMNSVFTDTKHQLKHKISDDTADKNCVALKDDYFIYNECNANKLWEKINSLSNRNLVIILSDNSDNNINNNTPKYISHKLNRVTASIDLCHFVHMDTTINQMVFNKEKLSNVIKITVRMLDNLGALVQWHSHEAQIDFNLNRQINIQIKNLGNSIRKTNILSEEKIIELSNDILTFINEETYRSSQELAAERGALNKQKLKELIPIIKTKYLSDKLLNDIQHDGIRNNCIISLTPYSLVPLNRDGINTKYMPLLDLVNKVDSLTFEEPRDLFGSINKEVKKIILEKSWNAINGNKFVNKNTMLSLI